MIAETLHILTPPASSREGPGHLGKLRPVAALQSPCSALTLLMVPGQGYPKGKGPSGSFTYSNDQATSSLSQA